MSAEREQWLQRSPEDAKAARWRHAVWLVSALVLALVAMMQRVRIPLPDGVSLRWLPPLHAALNAAAACCLVAALGFIKCGKVRLHRAAVMVAVSLSVLFLFSYVIYHLTSDPTRYGGTGWSRGVYFFLLATHILSAAVSLPFILFTWLSGWANQFARHRRLARWVWPLWLYVALTGPVCYLMLRPWYRG
jgi:putative membrane protein